jgi:hypothetical protein
MLGRLSGRCCESLESVLTVQSLRRYEERMLCAERAASGFELGNQGAKRKKG